MFQKGLRYSFCQLFFPNWWCNWKPKWLICDWVPNYPSSARTSPEQSCPANLTSLYCSCLCPHVTPGGEGGCRETKRGRNKRHGEERDAEERARKARQEAMCSRLVSSFHPVSWQIKTKLPSEHKGRSAGSLITSTCPSLIQPTAIHQHFKTSCLVNSELDVFLGVSQLTKKRSARDCVVINLANVSNGMVMWL